MLLFNLVLVTNFVALICLSSLVHWGRVVLFRIEGAIDDHCEEVWSQVFVTWHAFQSFKV